MQKNLDSFKRTSILEKLKLENGCGMYLLRVSNLDELRNLARIVRWYNVTRRTLELKLQRLKGH